MKWQRLKDLKYFSQLEKISLQVLIVDIRKEIVFQKFELEYSNLFIFMNTPATFLTIKKTLYQQKLDYVPIK